MSDVRAAFEAAVEKVRSAPSDGDYKPSNEEKLKMYAWFRQANDGDVSGKRPGMLDPIGRFKYDAWAKLKGMSQDEAMQQYIDQVEKVEQQFG
ncbi:MAG: acyl-CoA-binding protein [Nevskiales bacterium]